MRGWVLFYIPAVTSHYNFFGKRAKGKFITLLLVMFAFRKVPAFSFAPALLHFFPVIEIPKSFLETKYVKITRFTLLWLMWPL